jgi:hypothetical protein
MTAATWAWRGGALLALAGCGATIADPAREDDVAADAAVSDGATAIDGAPAPDAAPCVEGDAQVTSADGTRCYLYFVEDLSWTDARAACEAIGGDLATITDATELALIASIVSTEAGSGDEDAWLAATDVEIEGTFAWATGEDMGYTNWRQSPLEPNDGNDGPEGVAEDCMILEGDTGGLWDDRICENGYPRVCER